MESKEPGDLHESGVSWENSESSALRHFPCSENPTRALDTTGDPLTLLRGGTNSRMRIKVQDRLIEIHQRLDTYLAEWYV